MQQGSLMNLDPVFNTFPKLETPRLILREIVSTDRDAVFHLFGSLEVTRYNDIAPFPNVERADLLIERLRQRYMERSTIRWAVTLRGGQDRLIGTCGFNLFDTRSHFGEIGYDLQPAYWGQGIMTEAVGAMVRFGFSAVELNRIEANVVVGNAASVALLTKLGFRYEGVLRQRGYWKEKYHDLEWYALLREDLRF
jgi:[ribosomal protein S5]-alanine N-acetyltransferase